ncbi:MAG: hypothetical protein QXG39_01505 [Candidatus Aenigmatarchaeota archaeon]
MQLYITTEELLNFIYLLYRLLRNAIQWLLENTLFITNPQLAAEFANTITLLTTLTAILLIIELIDGAKKVLAMTLALGWTLFFISILFALF